MKDEIMFDGKWQFNEDVSECFDDMLSRSIPDYNNMRELTLNLADYFLFKKNKFKMLDLGCSNGINLEMFIKKYGNQGEYTAIDNSKAMLDKAQERLGAYLDVSVNYFNVDIAQSYINTAYDIITSILTIQFIPVEYRPAVYKEIYNGLKDGGIFILVEKILQPDSLFDELFVDSYYEIKEANGYTKQQIVAKKKSLEGVLVPLTHDGNMELLKNAGFKHIETFWKSLNFEGYILIK